MECPDESLLGHCSTFHRENGNVDMVTAVLEWTTPIRSIGQFRFHPPLRRGNDFLASILVCRYVYRMGNKFVTFTEDQLEDYQDCTFFTRKEILRVHKRFREINPEVVPKCMTGNEPVTVTVSMEEILKLPELRENPFRQRICEVFSHDDKGNLSFEDFLDLLSVFSEHAPRDIKVFYAFKIYDFDGDHHIGPNDLELALRLLTRNELSPEEITQICEKVIEESDVDGDGKLSFMEFEHVITRAPEFLSTFHIRM